MVFSPDGQTWQPAGTDFPVTDIGRIALGIQSGNPDLLYALVAGEGGTLRGLFRLDGIDRAWKAVSGLPMSCRSLGGAAQGNYDLAIAVDPEKGDMVYLGGSFHPEFGGASIWRCAIETSGAACKVIESARQSASTPIPTCTRWCTARPIRTSSGAAATVACFSTATPAAPASSRRRTMVSPACAATSSHSIRPIPASCSPACRTTARPLRRARSGSTSRMETAATASINWADPNQILVFCNGRISRSTNGGKTHESFSTEISLGWKTMTQPVVGLPFDPDPAHAGDAQRVATGAADRVYVSDDFGATWPAFPSPSLDAASARGRRRVRPRLRIANAALHRHDQGQGVPGRSVHRRMDRDAAAGQHRAFRRCRRHHRHRGGLGGRRAEFDLRHPRRSC